MHYYLTTYVGAGTDADPFRPRGTDGQNGMASTDLRPDCTAAAGRVLVAVNVRDDANIGGRYLGNDQAAVFSAAQRNLLANDLGISLTETVLRRIILEVMLNGGAGRWKSLVKTIRQTIEVHLGDLFVSIPVVAGGAVYTETFPGTRQVLGPTGQDHPWKLLGGSIFGEGANDAAESNAFQVGRARMDVDVSTSDNYSKCVIKDSAQTGNECFGVSCRGDAAVSSETNYMARWGDAAATYTAASINKRVTGSLTILAGPITDTAAAGDTLYIDANGSTIRQLRNGSLIQQVTDTAITTGFRGGIGPMQTGTPDLARVNQFEHGDLTVAPPPPMPGVQFILRNAVP